MKTDFSDVEKYRVRKAANGLETKPGEPCGAFFIPYGVRVILRCVVDNGRHKELATGWEHVSVSCCDRLTGEEFTPNWEVMCFVKNLFWEKGECVIQFHPPESEYVNIHKHVLHLWKPCGSEVETPPMALV